MTTEEEVGSDRSPSPFSSSEPGTSPLPMVDFAYEDQNGGVFVNMEIDSDNGLFGNASDPDPVENMETGEEEDDDAAAVAASGSDDGAESDDSEAASDSAPPSTTSEESAKFFQYMYSASESSSAAGESDNEMMDVDNIHNEQLQAHTAAAPAASPPSLSDGDSDDMIVDQVFATLPANHPRRNLYFKRKQQRRIARAKERMNRPSISYKVSSRWVMVDVKSARVKTSAGKHGGYRARQLRLRHVALSAYLAPAFRAWEKNADSIGIETSMLTCLISICRTQFGQNPCPSSKSLSIPSLLGRGSVLDNMVDCEDGLRNKAEVVWLPKLGLAGLGFPIGYHLFGRTRSDGVTVDPYLYGHPSGRRFRSPTEFQPHLVWLAVGDPSIRCKCQYCGELQPLSPERIKILRQRPATKWSMPANGDADVEGNSASDLDIAQAATEPPLELHTAREASCDSESDLDIARAATEPPLELYTAAPPPEASSLPLDTLTHEDCTELLADPPASANGVDRLIATPSDAVKTPSSTAVAPILHTSNQQSLPPTATLKRRGSHSPSPDLGSTVPSGPHQTPSLRLTRRCRPCFRFDSKSPSHSLSRERIPSIPPVPAPESTDVGGIHKGVSAPELNPSYKHRRSPSLDEDEKELAGNVRKQARTVANGNGVEAQESVDTQFIMEMPRSTEAQTTLQQIMEAPSEKQLSYEGTAAMENIGALAQLSDAREIKGPEAQMSDTPEIEGSGWQIIDMREINGSEVNTGNDRAKSPVPSKVLDSELSRTESGVASPFPSVPASAASESGDELATVYESDGCKANTEGLTAKNAELAAASPEASESESSSDEEEDEDDDDEYKIYLPRAGEIVWCLTARMNQTPLTSCAPGRTITPQYWPSVVISERVAEIAFPALVKRHGKQPAPPRGPRPGVWVEPLGLGALVPAADGSGVPIRPRTANVPIPANAVCEPTWIECRRLRAKEGHLRRNPSLIPFHAMMPQQIVKTPGTVGMVEYDRALIQATGIATTVETFTSDNSLTFEGFQGEARPTSPESDASTVDTFLAAVRLGADVLRVKDLVAVADRKTRAFVEPEHVVCIEALEKNRGNIFVIGNRLIPARKRKRGRGRAKKGGGVDEDDDAEQFWKFRAHHVLGRVQVATALGMSGWPAHPGNYGRGKGAESRGVWEGWVEAADILD
ncbi:hypothetical protein HDU87_006750 [Geranomyces variabilis]|uniref:Cryptic loci regulator 2 N-terminal domain-containing protein n=1 Tax=Geranomyces variabilis TaxID=109894 RepID=A0AAD5TPQ8_9FUNG|nr:hypothetical protein HDU87_006750 [Geranomyces variabilis]